MGIRALLAGWLLKDASVGGWNIRDWQSGKTYLPDTDTKSLIDRYKSWIYVCASKNAINCSQIPLRLYISKKVSGQKTLFPTKTLSAAQIKQVFKATSSIIIKQVNQADDIEEVVEHPLIDLLQKVNPFENRFGLFEGTYTFQELTGNAYWYIERGGTYGEPKEIWPLMPQYVKVIVDKFKLISGYEFSVDSNDKHFLYPENVIHFKYFNPADAIYGYAPLQACIIAGDLHAGYNIFEVNLLTKGGRPDMALVYPREMNRPSEEEESRIRKSYFKQHGGVNKAGGLAVLYGGATLENISLNPKEMNFISGRSTTREEIAGAFGVPVSMLTSEDVNRANAEAGSYMYMANTILPRIRRTEEKLNESFVPMFDENLFVMYDNPVPEDKEFLLKERAANLNTRFTSINEERAKVGLEPAPWGEAPEERQQNPMIENSFKAAKPKAPRVLPPISHPTRGVDKDFEKEMAGLIKQIGKQIIAAVDDGVIPSDLISGLAGEHQWKAKMGILVSPYLKKNLTYAGMQAISQVRRLKKIRINLTPVHSTQIQRAIQNRTLEIADVTDNLLEDIKVVIENGLSTYAGVAEIKDNLKGFFDDQSAYRAERIARTETIWAHNEGAEIGYKESGVVSAKQWMTPEDERTCEACLAMDGDAVGLDDNFNTPDGDYAHPPLHPNCRCSLSPIIKPE